jgi:hypothetical protein
MSPKSRTSSTPAMGEEVNLEKMNKEDTQVICELQVGGGGLRREGPFHQRMLLEEVREMVETRKFYRTWLAQRILWTWKIHMKMFP